MNKPTKLTLTLEDGTKQVYLPDFTPTPEPKPEPDARLSWISASEPDKQVAGRPRISLSRFKGHAKVAASVSLTPAELYELALALVRAGMALEGMCGVDDMAKDCEEIYKHRHHHGLMIAEMNLMATVAETSK